MSESITQMPFIQPSVAGSVSVRVDRTDWMIQGDWVYIAEIGHYVVSHIPGPTVVILVNVGNWKSARPGESIPTFSVIQSVQGRGIIPGSI